MKSNIVMDDFDVNDVEELKDEDDEDIEVDNEAETGDIAYHYSIFIKTGNLVLNIKV